MHASKASHPSKASNVQKVGKYILDEKIGVGGFGVVRKAHHEVTGTIVAVKAMDKAQLQLMQMTQQIKREILLLTTLKHPNIVSGLEILNSPSKLYLVMEFVDGGDMHTLIFERRRLSEAEAQKYFLCLAKGLAFCHARGVTHRDLKLENLLLTRDGVLKVCDFGLASIRGLNGDENQLCNTVVGTEDFAAPEILRQLPYDGSKADMWSAGIILYTMLAGYCPFQGRDTTALFQAIKNCRYTFPSGFPAGAKRVVSQLLVPDPAKRLSAADILRTGWLLEAVDEQDFTGKGHAVPQIPQPTASKNSGTLPELTRGNSDSFSDTCSKSSSCALSDVVSLRSHVQQNPTLALARETIPGFDFIYANMRQVPGLVQDRRYRLRVYPKTFVGEELVTWLASNCSLSRQDSVLMGDRMLQAEVFHHVCRDHCFKDEYLFYRFAEDDMENSSVLNMRQFWPSAASARDALTVSISLLSSLLALIRIHQALPLALSQGAGGVDTESLRKDEAFFSFRMASAELQVIDISGVRAESEKLAFLINLHHIMILHMRIYGFGSSQNRLQKAKHKLQYNIGGMRLTVVNIHQAVKDAEWKEVHTEEKTDLAREMAGRLSTKLALPSPRHVSQSRISSSIFTSLGRSGKFHNTQATAHRVDRNPHLAALFLSDGSVDCLPIRVLQGNTVSPDHFFTRLAEYLVRRIQFIGTNAVLLPAIIVNYRKMKGMHGDRELLVDLIEIIDRLSNASPAVNVEPELTTSANEVSVELKRMLSSGLPTAVTFADTEELSFAPILELDQ